MALVKHVLLLLHTAVVQYADLSTPYITALQPYMTLHDERTR